MSFIFFMSHQTGSQSSGTSSSILRLFTTVGINPTSGFGEFLHLMIRKGAHFFEYGVLATLIYNYVKEWITSRWVYVYSVIISFLYACTDEFHQTFVPNRSGQITDVLIDTSGAIIAVILILIYRRWIKIYEIAEDY